jgi:protein subunit release factor A
MMNNTVIVELRAGEGGDDAKLLVRDMMAAYDKLALRHCL